MEIIALIIGLVAGAFGMLAYLSRKSGASMAEVLRGNPGEERKAAQRGNPGEEGGG